MLFWLRFGYGALNLVTIRLRCFYECILVTLGMRFQLLNVPKLESWGRIDGFKRHFGTGWYVLVTFWLRYVAFGYVLVTVCCFWLRFGYGILHSGYVLVTRMSVPGKFWLRDIL